MYGLEVMGMSLLENIIKTVLDGSEFVIVENRLFRGSMTSYTNYWKVPLAVRIPQLYLNRKTGEKSTAIRSSLKRSETITMCDHGKTDAPPNAARRLQISLNDLPVCRVTVTRLTNEEILMHQGRRPRIDNRHGVNHVKEKEVVEAVKRDKNAPTRCAYVTPHKYWSKGKRGMTTQAGLRQVSSNKRKASGTGRYSKRLKITRSMRNTTPNCKTRQKRKRKTPTPPVQTSPFSRADELLANPYMHRIIEKMIPSVVENSFVPDISDLERITEDDPVVDEAFKPTFDPDPPTISVRVSKATCALASYYFHRRMYFNDILIIHAEVEEFSFPP